MLCRQMLPVQMSSWQLESAKEGPRTLPLKFGQNWASRDMASFPKEIIVWGTWTWTTISFPVVDFAASSRSWGSAGKLGLQSNWYTKLLLHRELLGLKKHTLEWPVEHLKTGSTSIERTWIALKPEIIPDLVPTFGNLRTRALILMLNGGSKTERHPTTHLPAAAESA